MAWYRPQTLAQALELLSSKRPKVVCGGTDLFVNWSMRQGASTVTDWMDIGQLAELKQIRQDNEGLHIGAAVTASEIAESPVCQQVAALQKAARVVGGWQIQNRASIGGNIANASPAADMVIPLAAYQARVNLSSVESSRSILLTDFIEGPRKTQLADNELITSVFIPNQVLGVPQTFLRHDQRGGTDISLVSVAAVVKGTEQHPEWMQIAVGAANYKPVYLPDLHQFLKGSGTFAARLEQIADLYAEHCHPISDVRASAEYRLAMVKVFLKRAVSEILL